VIGIGVVASAPPISVSLITRSSLDDRNTCVTFMFVKSRLISYSAPDKIGLERSDDIDITISLKIELVESRGSLFGVFK
jgi:hypothetical protein